MHCVNDSTIFGGQFFAKVMKEIQVVGLYDYDGTEQGSLSFSKGDIILVYKRLKSGWWDGQVGSKRGWFPSNYVGRPQVKVSPC
jgi:hypothetical protein